MTFTVTTHRFDTGALTDADAVPAYRIYEDETGTAIVTNNMAKLDDAGTTGFYSEQITLSAANGFEKGKSYNIYISAAVNSVTGATVRTFQIEAEVDANVVSGGVNVTSAAGTAWNSGAITASTIAADAIGASELATDAVNEIRDAIANLAMVQPSAVPAITATLKDTLSWILALSRNKITQTATTQTLRNDADSANIATSSHSSDGTTFTRNEWA